MPSDLKESLVDSVSDLQQSLADSVAELDGGPGGSEGGSESDGAGPPASLGGPSPRTLFLSGLPDTGCMGVSGLQGGDCVASLACGIFLHD